MASNAFLTTIEQRFLTMSRYEDKDLQKKARCLIPEILLELRAQEKMRLLQAQIKKGMWKIFRWTFKCFMFISIIA